VLPALVEFEMNSEEGKETAAELGDADSGKPEKSEEVEPLCKTDEVEELEALKDTV